MNTIAFPGVLRIAYEAGGVDAVLSLSKGLGGQLVFVPRKPGNDHALVRHAGRAAADAIASAFGGEHVQVPLGHRAIRLLLVKAMEEQNPDHSLNDLVEALGISRREAIRLRQRVRTGGDLQVKSGGGRRRFIDPRQIDIEGVRGPVVPAGTREGAPADAQCRATMALASIQIATGEDVEILALTVDGEAENQPFAGKLAVAYALVNRAHIAAAYAAKNNKPHPLFGVGSVGSACLRAWQFSCWNTDSGDRARMLLLSRDNPNRQVATAAALCAVHGLMPNPIGGCTYYYNPKAVMHPPNWALSADGKIKAPKVVIGAHYFFDNVS
jgi:N-acetylmuramoyl-L-alanine amidase